MATPDPVRVLTADTDDGAPHRNMLLALLVLDRYDWPRLQVARNESGAWDVTIRLDGGYPDRDTAEHVLASLARTTMHRKEVA